MNKIEEYRQMKRHADHASAWLSLHGNEYFGGARGKGGQYGSFITHGVSVQGLQIYHQEYDGATNYHECPIELAREIGAVLVTTGVGLEVIRQALASLQNKAQRAATEALEEHKALIQAAGLGSTEAA